MEVPEDILKLLKCGTCESLLSRGPVFLCPDGKGLCNVCHLADPSLPATRNTHYEAVTRLLLFPCRRKDDGCPAKVTFTDPEVHEEVCPHRQYVCPLLGPASCAWSGTVVNILDHCQQQHPDKVLTSPATLTHDITKSNSNTYLLDTFHLLFLLFTKICVTSGKIYYCIRYLGSSTEVQKFKYIVNITRDDESVIKKGRVSPQGCLAIQEDSSLSININYLLGILGGFDNTTFTLTLQRSLLGEKCSECNILLLVNEYRDSSGWKCKKCAPAQVACDYFNEGCKYKSFPGKCKQHELYFCRYAKYCQECKENVNGQITEHFRDQHFREHSWRSNLKKLKIYATQSNAGLIVCVYKREHFYFTLKIRTALTSDQLSNYRCVINVTQVATGYTRVYNPNPSYTFDYDWGIEITNKDFSDWSEIFDISVSLTKIKV